MNVTARRRGILNSGQGFWSPEDLGEQLLLWLDADAGSNFFQTSNDRVVTWFDRSGNNFNVTQSQPNQRPELIPEFLNNRSAVKFNSNNQQWLTSLVDFPLSGDPNFSVFVVYQKEVQTQGTLYGWGTASFPGAGFGLFDNNQSVIGYLYVGENTVRIQPIETQQPLIQGYSKTPGIVAETSLARRDGQNTIVSPGSIINSPNIAPRSLSVGRFADFGASYLNGYLFEMIVTHPILSNFDLLRVEGYFAHRWGIQSQLPLGHVFKNSPP